MENQIVNLYELKQFIEAADHQSDKEFHFIIKYAITLLNISYEDFAVKFDISVPSFDRWARGRSAPHPLLRKHVYQYLFEMVQIKLNNEQNGAK